MIKPTFYLQPVVASALCVLYSGCESDASERVDIEMTGDAAVVQQDASTPGAPLPQDAQAGQPAVPMGDLGENSQRDTFLRADSVVLSAPNVFAKPFGAELLATSQAQQTLNDSLVLDGDGDGFVDLSLLIRFIATADPRAQAGETTVGGGRCTQPYDAERVCGPDPAFPFQTPFLAYTPGERCALDGTAEVASAPCFATKQAAITLTLPLLGRVPLEHGQVIGRWDGDTINDGWVRGFLSVASAGTVRLPDPVPPSFASLGIKPGTPLTDFLSMSETAAGPDAATGWWFLLRFSAKPALFEGQTKPR